MKVLTNGWIKPTHDYIAYALELIRMAKAELMVQEIEINDNISNFNEANQLIDRIKNV